MQALASVPGSAARVARRDHNHHRADGVDVEFEALAAAKSRRTYHLDLDQLVVVCADPVDRLGAKPIEAPEFTDREFRGVSNATEYIRIAPRPQNPRGVQR
jgi:hypothetical protein